MPRYRKAKITVPYDVKFKDHRLIKHKISIIGTQNTPQVGAISVFTTAAAPLTATAASPTPIQQWTTEAPIQQGYQGSGSQANADSGAYAEFVQGPGFTTAAQQQGKLATQKI